MAELRGRSLTLATVMTPSCVAGSVEMRNTSMPSPLAMVKNISALRPVSLSVARMRPTGVPVGDDSRTLNWNIPEQSQRGAQIRAWPPHPLIHSSLHHSGVTAKKTNNIGLPHAQIY